MSSESATVVERPSKNRLDECAIRHAVAAAKLNVFRHSHDSHIRFDAAQVRSRRASRVCHLKVHVVSLKTKQ